MKKSYTFIKEHDWIFFGISGVLFSLMFYKTFKSFGDFLTRESVVTLSLILGSLCFALIITDFIKRRHESLEAVTEQTYFQTVEAPQVVVKPQREEVSQEQEWNQSQQEEPKIIPVVSTKGALAKEETPFD